MRYITITTWEISDGADYETSLIRVKEKRMPALIELGAIRVTIIQTSDRTSAAITEWPDAKTRDFAQAAIDDVRKKVHVEDMNRLTGEMRGEIVAQLEA